ncbi:PREDICTED: tektin-3-like [Ceratosolen solmsi marchali]|uniref:Tektin n=1 Tax=Ceratosolen solmsi marchali TaxID=326594 RepID=A0AAJ7E2R7_9HYME|nr:PREDICTED: tektin-3-like [Ceratosolen solmsi marchali]
MALFTSKNYPWKLIAEDETIATFKVPSYPITSQSVIPCYVPDDMNTIPLKFPSIIMGFDRHPIHVARSALGIKYTAMKSVENQNYLTDQVSSILKSSQVIGKNLDNLIRLAKERMETCKKVKNKEKDDVYLKNLKLKIDKITLKFEEFILEHKEMQSCKRNLQSCIQNIGVPLHISAECLHHRETRCKNEKINDKVEKMLMKESVEFRQNQQYLEKYLQQCETNLIKGRKIQSELENIIKNIQWNLFTNLPTEEIEIIENINQIWNKTNKAFLENCIQLKTARDETSSYLEKVKNEIFHVETNLKYLKTNKESHNELQQAENQLESLLKVKNNLELEHWIKIETLFIDEQKCMSLRRCYPKSIITNY